MHTYSRKYWQEYLVVVSQIAFASTFARILRFKFGSHEGKLPKFPALQYAVQCML